jgi:RNA polymerase sigma factor (sigma-70 family)
VGLEFAPPTIGLRESEPPSEEEILSRVRRDGAAAWPDFLQRFCATIFRVVVLFAESHDERMDLFLHICWQLRDRRMRRVLAFRERPDAPCRFSTYLAVVCRNLALDHLRAKAGRYRPFKCVAALEETERLLFEYHVREGRSLEETRSLLRGRHGIRLGSREIAARSASVTAALSASQRWKLLSRLASRRPSLSIDPVADAALGSGRAFALRSEAGDPERSLREGEAVRVLEEALQGIGSRRRLALTLRYRDSLSFEEVARTLGTDFPEAEQIIQEGLQRLRARLEASGIQLLDLESAGWSFLWSET